MSLNTQNWNLTFLSTLSLRRATDVRRYACFGFAISIHALLAESDRVVSSAGTTGKSFLSTLSLRRATLYLGRQNPKRDEFLSTLSLRRATVTVLGIQHRVGISIHALLAESDRINRNVANRERKFLSTLSLRRATHYDNYNLHCVEISIHALLAESDRAASITPTASRNFYPRSPCGERPRGEHHANSQQEFLSTLSLRRATARRASRQQPAGISIHALLAESDSKRKALKSRRIVFLSTLSLRRATASQTNLPSKS